jgi:putative hemolysin
MAPWLLGADKALSPLITLLEKSTKFFLKILNAQPEQPMVIQDDFVEIGQLGPNVRQYVLNTISAERKRASDVMIPWEEVRYVEAGAPIEKVESIAIQSGHTRLPVMSDGSIVGLINTKEIMSLIRSGETDWQRHQRPILRFRGGEPILNILQKMQENSSHMAAIYDRMDVAGVITLEDIMEEIIGDLYDEDDDGRVKRFLGRMRR